MPVNKSMIAKNTMMLYIRMIFVMAATLFTTRIVLKNLGVEDYGIYNVVAGVVSMFAFLNNSMAGATQRFLSFELGINNEKRLSLVFCQSVIIHLLIALIILLLAETIGLWFVYNKLIIPVERFSAAIWVYQIAILSFFFNVISVPYQASIIAHEKMSVYAWVSILDVVLKLAIAYLISISPYDKLVSYAFLILLTAIVQYLFYRIYSRNNFSECCFQRVFSKDKFTEMLSFAGWNVIGNMAHVFRMQGTNILLNMFSGPVVNAAYGVSQQVDGALEGFVVNFQTASNPQIVKSYAMKEYDETTKLVCQCSKYSFFLILLLSLPIFFQIDYILSIWLTEIPMYTSIFVQLILVNSIIDSQSKPIITFIRATGKMKWYSIVQGGLYLLTVPVIYCLLKNNYSPISAFITIISFTFIGCFVRLLLVKQVCREFSIGYYLKTVILPSFLIGMASFVLCHLLSTLIPTTHFNELLFNSTLMVLLTGGVIWICGVNTSERTYIKTVVLNLLKRGRG